MKLLPYSPPHAGPLVVIGEWFTPQIPYFFENTFVYSLFSVMFFDYLKEEHLKHSWLFLLYYVPLFSKYFLCFLCFLFYVFV